MFSLVCMSVFRFALSILFCHVTISSRYSNVGEFRSVPKNVQAGNSGRSAILVIRMLSNIKFTPRHNQIQRKLIIKRHLADNCSILGYC